MKQRKTPFGYIIKNGIVTVDKTEADIVREIAKQYLGGSSLTDFEND